MNITQKTLESIAFEAIKFRDRIEDACAIAKPSNSPLRNYSVDSLHDIYLALVHFAALETVKEPRIVPAIRYAIRAYDKLDSHLRDMLPARIGEFVESARGI